MTRLAAFGLLTALVVLPGCPDDTKESDEGATKKVKIAVNADAERCDKLADKTFAMAKELGLAMAKMLGAEKAAEMEKQMDADMAKEKPKVISSCLEAVKKDPTVIPVMDCMINAADLEVASKCDPDGKLKALGPKGGE